MCGVGIIGGHGRGIVGHLVCVVVVPSAVCHSGIDSGCIVVVIQRDIGEGRLGQGLADQFTFAVLQVVVITHGLFTCEFGILGKSLLLSSLHNITDTLVDLVASIFLNSLSARVSRRNLY